MEEFRTLTLAEVASRLKVSQLTVRRMWIRKTIPAPVTLGRVIRWRATDLEQWLAGLPQSSRYTTKETEHENALGTD